ncbi:YfdX family protein [Endozoicomonadaceae bacterium StTr2]
MKVSKTKALLFSGALTFAAMTGNALAGDSNKQSGDTVYVVDTVTIPGHARSVLSDISNARLALFEGYTEAANDLINKAQSTYDKSVSQYAMKLDDGKGYGIPVQSAVTFSEDFKPTPKTTKAIEKAGELAQKGEKHDAYAKMLNAGVELDFKYALLPVMTTVEGLQLAHDKLEDGKYYEANLLLKSIENSVVVEDFGALETPKQGYSWETISG